MALGGTPIFRGHKESYLPPIVARSHALQIIAGPAVMLLALGLQMLKKELTSTHKNELWQHIVKFLQKAEARDKVGRIVQYFCRFMNGTLAHLPAELALQAYKPIFSEVQTTLAWARRTHRWGKEMPHIPALGQAITSGDALEALQRGVLITFLVQDHIYWLLKVGILKFDNYKPVEWHRRNLRFINFSHVLNFALCVRDIRRIRAKQQEKDPKYSGSKEAIAKADSEIFDNKKMMFRYVLTFIQMLHVSQIKKMDDWYIGLMGVVSASIDASKQW